MTRANSGDSERPSRSSSAPKRSAKRVSGSTPNLYDVKGYISKCRMEFRVKAVNADAATKQGHDRGMRVSECVEVKKKRK